MLHIFLFFHNIIARFTRPLTLVSNNQKKKNEKGKKERKKVRKRERKIEKKKERKKERRKERENRARKITSKQKLVENVICKLRRWEGLTIFFETKK